APGCVVYAGLLVLPWCSLLLCVLLFVVFGYRGVGSAVLVLVMLLVLAIFFGCLASLSLLLRAYFLWFRGLLLLLSYTAGLGLALIATTLLYSWSWSFLLLRAMTDVVSYIGGGLALMAIVVYGPWAVVSLVGYWCHVPCCVEVRDSSGARGVNNRGCRLSPNSALCL
ncbi:hypothetical protein U1Q18_035124, partial [Sarracenia purpurea var. burkii]